MHRPVSHHFVLNVFHLLRRVEPTATVTGSKEIARIDGLVFTVSLAPTISHDRYQGLYLASINPAVGELDSTLLNFEDYKVTTGTGSAKRPLVFLDRDTAPELIHGVSTHALEKAVRNYVTAFTPAVPALN